MGILDMLFYMPIRIFSCKKKHLVVFSSILCIMPVMALCHYRNDGDVLWYSEFRLYCNSSNSGPTGQKRTKFVSITMQKNMYDITHRNASALTSHQYNVPIKLKGTQTLPVLSVLSWTRMPTTLLFNINCKLVLTSQCLLPATQA